MGKKCLITDDLIQICADNIRLGLSYAACAKAIGVTYQSWHNWEKLGADGTAPYAKWYIAIQAAESDLMKECMESVKMSMRLGDVKSAMFILERRFSGDYGKVSQVNMQSQNQNLNLNIDASPTADEKDQIRARILEKLAPKGRLPEFPRQANKLKSSLYVLHAPTSPM